MHVLRCPPVMSLHHTGCRIASVSGRKPALTLTYSLHTMEKAGRAEPPVFPDEQTSLLRSTTQALEAAAPHLRPACPAGIGARQHLRVRPVADEAAPRAISAGAETQLSGIGESKCSG